MKNRILLFSGILIQMTFPLTAQALLEIVPSSDDFGDAEVGASASTLVTVENKKGILRKRAQLSEADCPIIYTAFEQITR